MRRPRQPHARLTPHVASTRSGRRTYVGEWGGFRVPRVRAQAGSGEIELAFFRLPGRGGANRSATVVLSGGPGLSAIEHYLLNDSAAGQLDALAAAGDVILLDQRGTGSSRPRPDSPQRWALPLDRPITAGDVEDEGVARVEEAVRFWGRHGVSPRGFDTAESADDVDDLRRVLGLDRVNLLGVSYGSHLALSVIRRHGDHVGRAVLASVEGPDHTDKLPSSMQRGLTDLAALLAAERPGAGADLVERIVAVMESLTQRPRRETTADPDGGPPVEVVLGAHDLAVALSDALGARRAMAAIPGWIDAAENENLDWLAQTAASWRRRRLESLMFWCMDVASGVSPQRQARIEQERPRTVLGDVVNQPVPAVRSRAGLPVLGADFRSPISSPVPVLFISGTLDFRTPPANVEELIGGFPGGQHIVVENGAHSRDLFVPEVCRAVEQFLRHGTHTAPARVSAAFSFDQPAREPVR